MTLRTNLTASLVCVLAACSSSSDGPSNGNTSGTSSTSNNTSEARPTCGTATCDPSKEYCAVEASIAANGDITWKPASCKIIPSGCTRPAPASSCAPPDCNQDPSAPGCMSPPDLEKCSPQKFCDCVDAASTS